MLLRLESKKLSSFLILISIEIILQSFILLSEAQVCLVAPYFTSIYHIDREITTLPNNAQLYNFTLRTILNYETKITIRNLLLKRSAENQNNPTLPGLEWIPNEMRFELTNDDFHIDDVYYIQDRISPSKPIDSYSKSDYWKNLRFFYNDLGEKKMPAIQVIKSCSPAYIYDADCMIDVVHNNVYFHIMYKKSLRCARTNSDNDNRRPIESYSRTPLDTWTVMKTLSSVIYSPPFIFKFSYDGTFEIVNMQYNITPNSIVNYMTQLVHTERFIYEPLNTNSLGPMHTIPSLVCHKHIDQLSKIVSNSVREDMKFRKPIETITKISPNSYIFVTAFGPQTYRLDRDDLNNGFHIANDRLDWLTAVDVNTISIEAFSIADDDKNNQNPIKEIITVLYDFNRAKSIFCKGNINLNTRQLTFSSRSESVGYTIPDDIAHWKDCKKIVSVYGFLYSLHEYNDNILIDEGKWLLFEEELFEFPIEAMHIDGNELLIISKQTTLFVFDIDQYHCESLSLSNKRVLNYRQIFKHSLHIKQTLLEGRYFNGSNWLPEWTNQKETNKTYIYIIVGCIMALLLVAMVFAIVYYLLPKKTEQLIIYSKSGRSSIINQPSHSIKNSKQNNVYKTTRSMNVVPDSGRRQRASSPQPRSKSPKSPKSPKLPKSPKTTKTPKTLPTPSMLPLFSDYASNIVNKSTNSPKKKSKNKSPSRKN